MNVLDVLVETELIGEGAPHEILNEQRKIVVLVHRDVRRSHGQIDAVVAVHRHKCKLVVLAERVGAAQRWNAAAFGALLNIIKKYISVNLAGFIL